MATYNGRLLVCDRCGETVFCECTGEGETDGGYTRWNKFKPAEGWSVEVDIGNMCPRCTESYNEVIRQFKNGVLGTPIYHNPETRIEVL
jgi:hypothetical protein